MCQTQTSYALYTRTQTVLKTTPASWRDSHSRRAKGSPLSSARRCGRQRAQHRRVQVAKRVAEVLQREAVQGERRVRQHVPRPNNAQHSALRGAPAVDTTCSDLQWTVAAKHRGVPLGGDAGGSLRHLKGHHLRVDCGVPRAHEHIRRVLDGRASAAWCRCGLRPSGDAASHPCDAPRRRRRRCSPSLVKKA